MSRENDLKDREKDLKELTARLQQAAGANLQCVVLYGSAARGEFLEEHSDLNILCLVVRIDGSELAKLQPVSRWWWSKGHPAPLVFTHEELRDSADVFAIELLDMKEHHRILLGEDFLGQLEVPMDLHRLQVERELRINVIRLRERFLRCRRRAAELVPLMIASSSSFGALFHHALVALGEGAPGSRREAAMRLGALLGLNIAAFTAVLDMREGKGTLRGPDVEARFGAYLDVVSRVAQEIDQRLAARC